MKNQKNTIFKKPLFWTVIAFGILLNLGGWHGFGNFLLVMALLMVLNRYVLRGIIHVFQERILPGLMNRYEKMLHWVLKGARPARLLLWLYSFCSQSH